MAPRANPFDRAKAVVLRVWRTKNPRVALLRDLGVAVGALSFVLGGLWLYTGQDFPGTFPLVVIESGSMMRGPYSPCGGFAGCQDRFDSPPFGRVGTIDPGDLVLVKSVDSLDGVETAFGSGGRGAYGGHGDVVVYHPRWSLQESREDLEARTPIIHRAMLQIRAQPEGCVPNNATSPCRYQIPETCDAGFAAFVVDRPTASNWTEYCAGSAEPITLSLQRDGLYLNLDNYPCEGRECGPFYSGILTKGDNNGFQDQPAAYSGVGTNTCCPVQVDQLVGKARGEIPWFGLVKLSIAGNPTYWPHHDPTHDRQWHFLKATAPWDIWVSLAVALGVLAGAPVAVDRAIGAVRKRRAEKKAEASPPDDSQ